MSDYLREAHYETMKKQGLSDEEIERDFEQMLRDLKIWEDYIADKAMVQAIRNGELEETETYENAPWAGREHV